MNHNPPNHRTLADAGIPPSVAYRIPRPRAAECGRSAELGVSKNFRSLLDRYDRLLIVVVVALAALLLVGEHSLRLCPSAAALCARDAGLCVAARRLLSRQDRSYLGDRRVCGDGVSSVRARDAAARGVVGEHDSVPVYESGDRHRSASGPLCIAKRPTTAFIKGLMRLSYSRKALAKSLRPLPSVASGQCEPPPLSVSVSETNRCACRFAQSKRVRLFR